MAEHVRVHAEWHFGGFAAMSHSLSVSPAAIAGDSL